MMAASVSRGTPINIRLCSCGLFARPNQRNCWVCAAAANREYRKRLADKRSIEHEMALAGIVSRLRAEREGGG